MSLFKEVLVQCVACFSIVFGAMLVGAEYHLDKWQTWVFVLCLSIGQFMAWLIGYHVKIKKEKTNE